MFLDTEKITDKYIGIPYVVNGRDLSGLDCYGLVHIIYKEEFGIELPLFVEDGIEANRTQELINQSREGWTATATINAGDVIVFKVLGVDSHIALAISPTHFIHARHGYNSAIESFNSSKWKNRFVGSYKYTPNATVVMNGVPHPLQTKNVTGKIPVGSTVSELRDWVIEQYNIQPELKPYFNVMVNGKIIPHDSFDTTVLKDKDTIEYRVVPQSSDDEANKWTRTILTVAVIYAAAVVGSATGAVAATVGPGWAAVAAVATMAIGMQAVDQIAPIRQPSLRVNSVESPGSSERQLMTNGGANVPAPYGPIPFVLGKVRLTPPTGANTYQLFSADGTEAYLRMLLVWGYGPLFVDETTLKIGELPISNYEGITQITLDRRTEPSSAVLASFNGLYGDDKTQIQSGVELSCDGVAGSTPAIAGPWLDAASTDGNISDFTIAVHFPNGCRAIKSKGDGAGASSASPVQLQVEYKKISAGSWISAGTFTVGATPVKDAFTWVKKITYESTENVQVRIRRLTGTGNGVPTDEDYQWVFSSTLLNTTFSRNTRPAIDPLNCKIAKTAFEIKATDQLNGSIEGINAIVQTYAKIWNGSAWVDGTTSNPAALFRHVLEHPANPRRITDATNKIDLVQLQYWYNYCVTKGFEYNAVVSQQRSVLDVLRDICAAGRASPTMIDGKWTVVIDEPKSNIVQHFTPHNSWGFSGTKAMPKYPDGLRVTFFNEAKGYQEDETIVYAAGKNEGNAELLESISVPGVTKLSLAQDHARWQMASAKLRPERYSLNADIEYIVANRGDRVKVMHDVPMWGLGSGRINNVSTNIALYSEQFSNAYWVHDSTSSIGAKTTAPNSTLTADKLLETTSSAGHYRYKTITASSGVYNVSAYLKQAERQYAYIQMGTDNQTKRYTVLIDLATGNFVLQASIGSPVNTSYRITDAGNGWWRLSLTATHNTGTVMIVIGTSNSANPSMPTYALPQYVGDITKGIYIWGAQVKSGDHNSLYSPTTTIPVTVCELDESLPMTSAVDYTIRVRGKSGNSTVRNIVPKTTSGYFNNITLSTTTTLAEVDSNDMFLFGELNQESQDCVVLTVEPLNNKSANITLVDYGVTSSYNIFNDYLDYTNAVAFESAISIAPENLIQSFGTKVPAIINIVSDETAMERIAAGVFAYKMQVSFSNDISLPSTTQSVEMQYDYSTAIDYVGVRRVLADYTRGSITATGVDEGDVLKVRLRYVGKDGRTGQWTTWTNHTIVGKTNPPAAVTGLTATPDTDTGKLKLAWSTNLEPDISGYELRTDTLWGNPTNLVFLGDSLSFQVTPPLVGNSTTYYIKAIDYSNNYSVTATSTTYTPTALANITAINHTFYDTSTSSATITLSWTPVSQVLGLAGYQVSYGSETRFIDSNSILFNADWTGDRIFTVNTIDNNGNMSTGFSKTITKLVPDVPPSFNFLINQGTLVLDWVDSVKTTLPIWGYEVRTTTVFGDNNYIFKGATTSCNIPRANIVSGSNTYYIKSIDTDNNYSSTYLTCTTNIAVPSDISVINHTFDTSSTSADVTLSWADVNPPFGLDYYEVSYDAIVLTTKSNNIIIPANWIANRTFTIKVVDKLGYKSAGISKGITKLVPNPVLNFRAQVIDNTVMFYWDLPAKTTLPIDRVTLKKSISGDGSTWETAISLGDKKGSFTTQNETRANTYVYWIATIDTDNRESTPVSITTTVAQPPDFIFNASYDSTFASTKSSAVIENAALLLPVNTTETWQSHFTTRSWVGPEDPVGTAGQVDQSYPIFVQPANGSGYYEEIFDYGSLLASSKVNLSYEGTIISGTPVVSTQISISTDGISYTDYLGVTEVFALSFRYIKVRITVTEATGRGLYSLNYLNVTLDSKLINDAGSVSALSTDTVGTIVNFNREFVNVTSVTVSPAGTTAIIPVYDIKGNNAACTYAVVSNVCTVTCTAHGYITGQDVRLQFSSGNGIRGVYRVTSHTANTFTVDMIVANTSGNGLLSANSFRVYLFNTAGTRVSATTSWAIKGY